MTYVALLRGINVGGNRKVEMAKLRLTFESLGFKHIKTLIASGNIIFVSELKDKVKLTKQIENAIEKDFGFRVDVLLRNMEEIEKLIKALPDSWVNNKETKCYIMFLWDAIDGPEVLEQVPSNPKIEEVRYLPGAIGWLIEWKNATKSKVAKITGTKLYKQLTIRNPNTVRKIYAFMQESGQ